MTALEMSQIMSFLVGGLSGLAFALAYAGRK